MPLSWGSIDRTIGGTAKLLKSHKAIGITALVALAAMKVHPFKEFSHSVQAGLTGDPNTFDTMAMAAVRGNIGGGWATNGPPILTQAQIGQSDVSHEDTRNYYSGPNPNPDGRLVLGLYNARLKGP